jgi:predicted lipid-binding transport protein (Tim44 family)
MNHPILLYAIALAAFAGGTLWLLLRARRAARAQPRDWGSGYDLTQLGQESFQPTQRFEGLAPAHPARADGFDEAAFLLEVRQRYLDLRQAWDAGDLGPLRDSTAPEFYARLQAALDGRGGRGGRSEVVTLQALLLELRARDDEQRASVELAGLVRDGAWGGAQPVREVWQLVRPLAGGDWTLAGIETLG